MLSKLLNELSRQGMASNPEDTPKPISSKRKHAELSPIPAINPEPSNLQVKLEISEEHKLESGPAPKLEPTTQTLTSKPATENFIEERLTKMRKQENQYPGKNVFQEVWEHFALQNQMLYQEMMIQRMRMMMNSVLWSQTLADKNTIINNNK